MIGRCYRIFASKRDALQKQCVFIVDTNPKTWLDVAQLLLEDLVERETDLEPKMLGTYRFIRTILERCWGQFDQYVPGYDECDRKFDTIHRRLVVRKQPLISVSSPASA
jgi:hypothetical protein